MKKDNKIEKRKAVNEGRQGYKHTPLGWIPEEWNLYNFDDCISIRNGQIDPKKEEYKNEILIAPNHIESRSGRILYLETAIEQKAISGKYQVYQGDIIYSKIRPYLQKAAIAPANCLCSADMYSLYAKNNILQEYIFYTILSAKFTHIVNGSSARTGIPKVNREELSVIPLCIPPTSQQQKIISILSTWDSVISKTQQLIEKLRWRNKGLMQELLTGKKGWQEKRLFDIFQRVVDKNTVGNTNVVTISAQRGFVKQDDFFKKIVASDILDNYYLVKKGDFCYNKSYSNGYEWGAIKKLNDFDQAVVTTLYICFRIRNPSEHSSDFFEYFFEANLLNKGLAKIAHEGGRAHGLLNVTPTDFFGLKILIPPYKDQIKIYNILSTANDELKMAIEKLNLLVSQKRGLMQKLITGEIRTKN